MSRIGWILFPEMVDDSRLELMRRTLQSLNDSDMDARLIIFSPDQVDHFEDVPTFVVDSDESSVTWDDVEALERRYGRSLRPLARPEIIQWTADLSPPEAFVDCGVQRLAAYVQSLEDHVSTLEYDALVFGVGPHLADRAAHLVASHGDACPVMMFPSSLTPKTQFGFTSEMATYDDMVGLPEPDDIDEQALEAAQAVIERQRSSGKVDWKLSSRSTVDRVATYLKNVARGFGEFRTRRGVVGHTVRKRLTAKYNRYRRYDDYDPDPAHVLFAMHHPIDTQLTLRGTPYLRQETVVERLSAALPATMSLFVKEHPSFVGGYRRSLYDAVDRAADTHFVPPETDPHDAIGAAEAVVTINSTTGLEAIMHDTPVMSLGRLYYNGAEIVNVLSHPYEFESTLRSTLATDGKQTENVRFIARLLEAEFDIPDRTTDPANAEQMATGIETLVETTLEEYEPQSTTAST